MRRIVLPLALVVAVVLTACAPSVERPRTSQDTGRVEGQAEASPTSQAKRRVKPRGPTSTISTVAEAQVPKLRVWNDPADAAPAIQLPNPRPSGAPLVLLVASWRSGWLEVLLPVRPNGSRGWVHQDDVTLTQHDWRIEVALGAHRLVAWKGDEPVVDVPVGVGRNATPTPDGIFYTTELLRPPKPNSVYGAYAFGLSGYSDVLMTFKGGPGELGLHGTNNPASVGRDVSSGCLRVTNDVITELAGVLPLGTPVFVTA